MLEHNYRTHRGILRFSSLLLEVLAAHDPQFGGTETSASDGDRPLFVCGVPVIDFL